MMDAKEIAKRFWELNPNANRRSVHWFQDNKEYWEGYLARWQAGNKDKVREYRNASEQRRRASKLNCKGSHTAKEWQAKKCQYNNRCAYCRRKMKHLTKDHLIPLSKGGTDFIDNIIPACQRCNSSKCNHDLLDWRGFESLQTTMNMQ